MHANKKNMMCIILETDNEIKLNLILVLWIFFNENAVKPLDVQKVKLKEIVYFIQNAKKCWSLLNNICKISENVL